MKARVLLIVVIAVLSGLLVWLAFFWEPVGPRPIAQVQAHSQLQRAETFQGGDFTLQGVQGAIALHDYRGKVALLYLGYTYCPDVCPTSLSLMGQAISGLEPAERERVQGIFISVDPERDTLQRLKEYASFFHPSIIGISGSSAQVAAVARQYGAVYAKQKPDAEGQYSVDHSSVTYVIAPDGKLAASLPHGTTPQQIIASIRSLLDNTSEK